MIWLVVFQNVVLTFLLVSLRSEVNRSIIESEKVITSVKKLLAAVYLRRKGQ